jgi:hypothetical protein
MFTLLLLFLNFIIITSHSYYPCTQFNIATKPYNNIMLTQLYCNNFNFISCNNISIITKMSYSSILCNSLNQNTCIEYNIATHINDHNITTYSPYCYNYNNNYLCTETEIVKLNYLENITCVKLIEIKNLIKI